MGEMDQGVTEKKELPIVLRADVATILDESRIVACGVDDRINVTNRVEFCKATFASALIMYCTRCHVINTI